MYAEYADPVWKGGQFNPRSKIKLKDSMRLKEITTEQNKQTNITKSKFRLEYMEEQKYSSKMSNKPKVSVS